MKAGPSFDYFSNAVKNWLLVKPDSVDDANAIFDDTHISITTKGHPVLGSPIGTSVLLVHLII